MTLDTNTWQW